MMWLEESRTISEKNSEELLLGSQVLPVCIVLSCRIDDQHFFRLHKIYSKFVSIIERFRSCFVTEIRELLCNVGYITF